MAAGKNRAEGAGWWRTSSSFAWAVAAALSSSSCTVFRKFFSKALFRRFWMRLVAAAFFSK